MVTEAGDSYKMLAELGTHLRYAQVACKFAAYSYHNATEAGRTLANAVRL